MNLVEHFKKGAMLRADYRETFSSPSGKRVLSHLGRLCKVADATFTPDERRATWNESRRALWLQIVKTLTTNEEDLLAEIERLQDSKNEHVL